MMSLPSEPADIETSSEEYARRFAGEAGEYFLEVQTRAVLDLLAPWPRARVLDVGGGHAQLALPLVQHGYDVTVVGSSERCRERLDRLLPGGSFRFQSCHLLALPFAERAFDLVLAFRLLPHAGEWRRLLSEMCRVAGSALVLDYPDRRSFNFFTETLFGWKKAIEHNTRPYRCFTKAEILAELSKHNFGRPLLRRQFFVPMVIHRAVGRQKFSRSIESLSQALGLRRAFGSPVILRAVRVG
jgi:SAM-dependent methyltransferase